MTTTVYILICSDAFWIGCFLGFFFFVKLLQCGWECHAGTCILQVDSRVSISPFRISRGFTQLKAIQCKQTLQLFIQILSQKCNVCPPLPDEQWGELWPGIKMPTLHYGWSTDLQLAAWGWGSDEGQGQSWLSSWLLC